VRYIDAALWSNYYLRVAYFDEETLADRLNSVETVQYIDFDESTGDVTAQRLALVYEYWKYTAAGTGDPT
jgi:hypothetical protein